MVVSEMNPEEQGLKPRLSRRCWDCTRKVSEMNPEEQGLKLANQETVAAAYTVSEMNPEEQGLKPVALNAHSVRATLSQR